MLPGLLAADGALFLDPPRGDYTVGESFQVVVRADTDANAINAAEAELSFDTTALSIETVSINDSILTLWSTEPVYSNETGRIRFAGWANTTFSGSGGQLATLTFRVLQARPSSVHITSGAMLAADGRGSNIISEMRSGLYGATPRQIETTAPTSSPEERVIAAIEAVQPPVISEYRDRIQEGERALIRGFATPESRIRVTLRGEGGPETTDIESDGDGYFTYASDQLTAGVYRVTAETIGDEGEPSTSSETLVITVDAASGLVAAAAASATLLDAALPFISLLLISGLLGGYLLHRHAVARLKHTNERS